VLREFGLELPDDVEVRVWDSSARHETSLNQAFDEAEEPFFIIADLQILIRRAQDAAFPWRVKNRLVFFGLHGSHVLHPAHVMHAIHCFPP
jgi:hypothetical protein